LKSIHYFFIIYYCNSKLKAKFIFSSITFISSLNLAPFFSNFDIKSETSSCETEAPELIHKFSIHFIKFLSKSSNLSINIDLTPNFSQIFFNLFEFELFLDQTIINQSIFLSSINLFTAFCLFVVA
jgi:hypothetical protein